MKRIMKEGKPSFQVTPFPTQNAAPFEIRKWNVK
jgi:hypothetical protein